MYIWGAHDEVYPYRKWALVGISKMQKWLSRSVKSKVCDRETQCTQCSRGYMHKEGCKLALKICTVLNLIFQESKYNQINVWELNNISKRFRLPITCRPEVFWHILVTLNKLKSLNSKHGEATLLFVFTCLWQNPVNIVWSLCFDNL